ncbi:MAG: NOL1/NOP2/sun family putative RNA methylase [Erysipelotrichaceae bacterium]|nr:NOL1/NOP2/sun family putative RNA methylase [Erysipelotrichaceae bacterium]
MNQEFLTRMKELLKDEFDVFEASLTKPMYRGIRYNPLKITKDRFLTLFPYACKQTPFCEESFYLENEASQVGNHPLHLSGACYMQEPSASAPVEILDVKENDWVLDLCAAPGGKSTQIAAQLKHSGLLVCNEIERKRAHVLMSNMERMGFGEVIITGSNTDALCSECAGWFDKVLVDAPCSGEGMMKKHDLANTEWSEQNIQSCANRQLQILKNAVKALKKGGILVYSTCTYALEENEQVVSRFLKDNKEMIQLDCKASFGRSGFPVAGMKEKSVCRIFPMDQGEGHFIAKFQKITSGNTKKVKEKKHVHPSKDVYKQLESIIALPQGYFDIVNEQLYYRVKPFLDLGNITVLRQGIRMGEMIKQRIEPHQHLFTSSYLRPFLQQSVELDDAQLRQFLKGEQLNIAHFKGYTAITWHGQVIGFGKGDGSVIKNKYPKGLRKNNLI